MTGELVDWWCHPVGEAFALQASVVKMQVLITSLGQSKEAVSKRGMTGSPDRKGSGDRLGWYIMFFIKPPELDRIVQAASGNLPGVQSIPVHPVYLGGMCFDTSERLRTPSVVPYPQEFIMRRRKNMRCLPIPLDLGGPRKPIAKRHPRLEWSTQVPAMDITIHGAGSKDVGMVGGEIDVCNCTRVAMKNKFDRRLPARQTNVPYQCFLVGCAYDPMVTDREWGPLYICNFPGCFVCQVTRRRIWRVEVDNMDTFLPGSGQCLGLSENICLSRC